MLFLTIIGLITTCQGQEGRGWKRHTIDRSSRGADGIRLRDVNGDGRLDIATGWEEGGVIRAYLMPQKNDTRKPWPAVTVGNVKSAEDAIFVDLDSDGAVDVISLCEGRTQAIFFHFAPTKKQDYLMSAKWQTVTLPPSQAKTRWMFAVPLDVDGKNGIDLVVASKNPNGVIGWFESPKNPRSGDDWKFHSLRRAAWVMSLITHDMDRDGDLDVVYSDRKGTKSQVGWLQNRGPEKPWPDHVVGAQKREVMFIDLVQKRNLRILAAVKPNEIHVFDQTETVPKSWSTSVIRLEREKIGTAKSVRQADVDLDGQADLVFSCENATGSKHGVVWCRFPTADSVSSAQIHSVSGPDGVKFDLLQLIDVDQDGDLDVLTCEERQNLGVVWYENPTR